MNKLVLQKAEKIKMSDFTILDELARHGSLREVARLVQSTPVQISRRLKIIEKAMGYRVFERGPKGLSLTGQGHELMKSVQAVNGEFHAMLSRRREKQKGIDRPMGIAATSFLTSFAVVPVMSGLMKDFPAQRFYVHAFNPDDLISAGVKGAFHIAVHPNPMDWPRSWQTELVGHMGWGLFAKKGHPLTRSLKDLEEVPFVYPLMWDGGKLVVQNDNCPLPVLQRNSYVGTQTAEQARHFVYQSHVVGFLPRLLMREEVERGKAVEIDIPDWPSFSQPIHLSVRIDSVPELYYRELKSRLRDLLE